MDITNPYYNPTGNPATGSQGLSALMRTEFANISTAFGLLPTLAGNGGLVVAVNLGGTALTVVPGSTITTTGAFTTIFAQAANVTLTLPGVNGTLALLASPAFTGTPTAPTASGGTNTTQLATTAFVTAAVGSGGVVSSVAGRTGAVVLTNADISGSAPLASPALTGVPTAPTASGGTNTTQVATTAFVTAAVGSGGVVSSVAGRTGAVVLSNSDVSGSAPLASPALTGTPTTPTAAPGTNTTQASSTAFVTAAVAVETSRATTAEALLAPKASPAFTGNPTAPTASPGDNDTSVATTAFVTAALAATGWQTISSFSFSAVTSQAMALSTSFRKFRISLQGVFRSTTGGIYLQFSSDGGSTYDSTTNYWALSANDVLTGTSIAGNSNDVGVLLSPQLVSGSSAQAFDATSEIYPGSASFRATVRSLGFGTNSANTTLVQGLVSGAVGTTGVKNFCRLSTGGAATMTGVAILEGLV